MKTETAHRQTNRCWTNSKRFSVSEELPAVFQRVIVVCHCYKCLGYLDAEKIWHFDCDNKEIQNVIAWEEYA